MEKKDGFKSNFGFLMAALGSAIGLGNLWSFPYKLGVGGGFAFLLIYAVLCVTVGYPLVLSEIALGRKTQTAAIGAYRAAGSKWSFNGVLQTIVPCFLISFYCTMGGYIIKYLVSSVGALFGGELATANPTEYWVGFFTNGPQAVGYVLIFIALTMLVVIGGISGGIEKFCKYGMPALFGMLVIFVIRACTLPGSGAGIEFLFKPDFSGMTTAKGFFDTLSLAGGQMFFSLSVASACLIVYGSYLGKKENLVKDAAVIVTGDTLVATFAGMAIFPAVFAFGMEPRMGAGLVFVSMTTVFQSMGKTGLVLQIVFWILVFIAALSSSIGMLEGSISAILDERRIKGKKATRLAVTLLVGILVVVGNMLTTLDCLGESTSVQWLHILGQVCVADVWDCLGEGILMPLTGMIMAILLGWVRPHWLDDEILQGSNFRGKKFYHFCLKYVSPLFMAMIIYGQIQSWWGK